MQCNQAFHLYRYIPKIWSDLPNQSNNVNNTTNDPTVNHSTNSVFVIWTRQELYLLAMCMCVSVVQSPGLCVIQISIQWDFHNMEYVQFLEIGTILRKSIYSLTTAHRPYPPHSRPAQIQAKVPLFELTTRYWQTRCSLPAKVIIILRMYILLTSGHSPNYLPSWPVTRQNKPPQCRYWLLHCNLLNDWLTDWICFSFGNIIIIGWRDKFLDNLDAKLSKQCPTQTVLIHVPIICYLAQYQCTTTA